MPALPDAGIFSCAMEVGLYRNACAQDARAPGKGMRAGCARSKEIHARKMRAVQGARSNATVRLRDAEIPKADRIAPKIAVPGSFVSGIEIVYEFGEDAIASVSH
jgi:hypothetical protein